MLADRTSLTSALYPLVVPAVLSAVCILAYAVMQRNKVGKLPLVREGRLVGLYSYADARTLMENEVLRAEGRALRHLWEVGLLTETAWRVSHEEMVKRERILQRKLRTGA